MEYVSKVTLEVNGRSIEDFKSVDEKKRELRKEVKLMNRRGVVRVTPEFKIDVEAVIPIDGSEFPWDTVDDGTLTLAFPTGKRVTFSGVSVLAIGDLKMDGEKEATRTIELVAMGRTEE
jgi:hypothetical protein